MATQTTVAIDGHGRSLTVDAPSISPMPFLFDLDSETLRCVAGGTGTNWQCDRGFNSSPVSAHDAGTAVVETAFVTAAEDADALAAKLTAVPADYVDPASLTFAADLVAALVAAGLMAAAPEA
jgi:hypothetical protein